MLEHKNSHNIHNAISSQELVAGPSLCNSLGGLQMFQSGQDHVHASHSAPPEKDSAKKTSDTSGPSFDASSSSAVLQRSLENKLRANLDVSGSPEYVLTWKHWDMELGPPICALRAAARRTSGKDYSGWPTPTVRDAGGQSGKESAKKQAELGHPRSILAETVMLTGWATPQHCDGRGATGPASKNRELGRDVLSSTSEAARPAAAAINPAMSRWLMGYHQEPQTQGWDTCSPGWQSWGTIQKLLGEYSRKQDGTESAG